MEAAVHQPMTAHLEASAVAGISSPGLSAEREAVEPTIVTSSYRNMGKNTPLLPYSVEHDPRWFMLHIISDL